MGKGLDFFREIITDVVDDRALNYGIRKAADILLDLEIDDERFKQVLVKHFDIRYSEAETVLIEAKEFHKNNS